MSAWIVSKTHIDAMVSWGVLYGVEVKYRGKTYPITEEMADKIGQILWDENYKSVNYRYDENNKAPKYEWDQYSKGMYPMLIIKGCACYGYQSCETNGWPRTMAFAISDAISKSAISKMPERCRYLKESDMPGWDEAPWGIDE